MPLRDDNKKVHKEDGVREREDKNPKVNVHVIF